MARLVAIVGIDGSGKTTQAKALVSHLRGQGVRARYFENAGGRPPINWLARRLGHGDGEDWLGAEALEAVEQRVRHLMMVIASTWSRLPGERVAVLDRWTVCQFAAMRARGRADAVARHRYRGLPWPDEVFFLDVAPDLARRRLVARGRDVDTLEWLLAADAAYRSLPEWGQLQVVDGRGPVEQVLSILVSDQRG